MKRYFVWQMVIVFIVLAVMPMFLYASKIETTASAESQTIITDIIGIDNFNSEQNSDRTEDTPVDTTTGELMEGYSITPATDSQNQISSKSYGVNSFSLTSNQSIFMWIYFPDDPLENFLTLTITFTATDGSKMYWSYDPNELRDLIQNITGINRGWKLMEFSPNDATIESSSGDELDSVEGLTFSQITIDYSLYELFSSISQTTGKLSIYHVYVASAESGTTSVYQTQSYVCYKLKSNFSTSSFNIYVGDTFIIEKVSDVFEYLYIGKDNLVEYTYQKYSWTLEFTIDGESSNINFGQSISIDSVGWYNLTIKINEARYEVSSGSETTTTQQQEVFALSRSFYVSEYSFCSVQKNNYTVKIGQTIAIVLTLTNDFVLNGDIQVSIGNQKVANISYEQSDENESVFTIYVEGLKVGSSDLVISATGNRESDSTESEYIETISISVEKADSSVSFSLVLMWVVLGVYLAGLFVFFIFLLVNARKNNVR